MYSLLKPEVAGVIGDNSILDNSCFPPNVSQLNYQFDGWLGDDLLETMSYYIVTASLRKLLEAKGATGCGFEDVEITTSKQFREIYPNRKVSKFYWLQITGEAGRDDFGMAKNRLIVSDKILAAMSAAVSLDNCDIEVFA